MGYITCFIVKAQINYMWSLNLFQNEWNFMCEYIFILYVLLILTQSV